jgi:hypothetical protein
VVGPGVVGRVVAAARRYFDPSQFSTAAAASMISLTDQRYGRISWPTIKRARLANAGWNEQAANLLQPKIDLAEIDHLA